MGIFHLYNVWGIFVYGPYRDREGNISIREINIRNDATCTDEFSNCDLSCGDQCSSHEDNGRARTSIWLLCCLVAF